LPFPFSSSILPHRFPPMNRIRPLFPHVLSFWTRTDQFVLDMPEANLFATIHHGASLMMTNSACFFRCFCLSKALPSFIYLMEFVNPVLPKCSFPSPDLQIRHYSQFSTITDSDRSVDFHQFSSLVFVLFFLSPNTGCFPHPTVNGFST